MVYLEDLYLPTIGLLALLVFRHSSLLTERQRGHTVTIDPPRTAGAYHASIYRTTA